MHLKSPILNKMFFSAASWLSNASAQQIAVDLLKNERLTADGPAAARVINFEFAREPGGIGNPLPKMKRIDKTRRMISRAKLTRQAFVLPHIAESEWNGFDF